MEKAAQQFLPWFYSDVAQEIIRFLPFCTICNHHFCNICHWCKSTLEDCDYHGVREDHELCTTCGNYGHECDFYPEEHPICEFCHQEIENSADVETCPSCGGSSFHEGCLLRSSIFHGGAMCLKCRVLREQILFKPEICGDMLCNECTKSKGDTICCSSYLCSSDDEDENKPRSKKIKYENS